MNLMTAHLYLTKRFEQKGGMPVSMPTRPDDLPYVAVGSWNADRVFYRLAVGKRFASSLMQKKECPNEKDVAKIGQCPECRKMITQADFYEAAEDQCGIINTKVMAKHNIISWIPPVTNGNIIETPTGRPLLVEERARDRYDRRTGVRLRVDGILPRICFDPKSHSFLYKFAHGQFWAGGKMIATEKILVVTGGDRVSIIRSHSPELHERVTIEFTGSVFKVIANETSPKPFNDMSMPYTDAELNASARELDKKAPEAEKTEVEEVNETEESEVVNEGIAEVTKTEKVEVESESEQS